MVPGAGGEVAATSPMIVIPVMIAAIVVLIPPMIVADTAALAFPIAVEPFVAIMAGRNPM